MSHLILIRHSLVDRGALGPDTDWPLSAAGRDLCTPLAETMQPYVPQFIVTSPMRRAAETAELIAAYLGVPWSTASGLEEHRRPFILDGLRPEDEFDAIMRSFFASPAERVFGEESAGECRNRFAAAIDAILASEPDRNVAVVTHGTVLALYAAPLFNRQPIDLWRRIGWPSFVVIDPATGTGLHLQESIASE